MDKYKVSILVPGIRTANWKRLYDSMFTACTKHTWEMIFIGPYPLPKELEGKDNITYIEDWGSPIRCQQRGLMVAKGEWINWAADDGIFLDKSLDVAMSLLGEHQTNQEKHVILGKYFEGNGENKHMKDDKYYVLSNHAASRSPLIPKHYFMLNVGMVNRKTLLDVGGWDCQFEVCPMAYNDLAIRLQNYGCTFIPQHEMMFACTHLPGHTGDHGPIHDGQTQHDEPLFQSLYTPRMKIDPDNWMKAEERWGRRFGKE